MWDSWSSQQAPPRAIDAPANQKGANRKANRQTGWQTLIATAIQRTLIPFPILAVPLGALSAFAVRLQIAPLR